jgi:hypothetical protein
VGMQLTVDEQHQVREPGDDRTARGDARQHGCRSVHPSQWIPAGDVKDHWHTAG